MVNQKLAKVVKKKFKEYKRSDESIDECFERLFEEANTKDYEYIEGVTSILINDSNNEKIQSLKAYPTESFSAVVLRLLESVD